MNTLIKRSAACLAIVSVLAGCNGEDKIISPHEPIDPTKPADPTEPINPIPEPNAVVNIDDITSDNPLVIAKGDVADIKYDAAAGIKTLSIQFDTAEPYEVVSLYLVEDNLHSEAAKDSNMIVLVDNLDIPDSGKQTLEMLVNFKDLSTATLRVIARNGELKINELSFFSPETAIVFPSFSDISEQAGMPTEITYKYGGPSVGDVDGDGDYDFILNNHNYVSPQMLINNDGVTVSETKLYDTVRDWHGTALGDYDNDGDLDIIVGMGGANGTNPSSYELLRNDGNDVYTFLSPAESGIAEPSRGRSPRFIDFNKDGLLDLVFVNAKTDLPDYDYPQHHFYKNLGPDHNYKFEWVNMPGISTASAERVLVLDYDNDNIDDLLFLSPPSLWRGTGNGFEDMSDLLPDEVRAFWDIQAATVFDVNNDGAVDLYLARGLPEYQLSRKSADFNATAKTLDIRDDGETGKTAIEFESDGDITLSHLNLTYRQYNDGYPLFIGHDAKVTWMSATGFQESQLHPDMKDAPEVYTFSKEAAAGFPATRDQNGIYIGYLDGKWQMEWVRTQNVYWDVSFSLDNVENLVYKGWEPQNRNRQDYLLVSEEGRFVDRSEEWKIPQGGDHWGVTNGDFNNDGKEDLFIYRFGHLKERVADLLLINDGSRFHVTSMHGAHDLSDTGHGDMGQAFDFDGDGKVDLLSGSNEEGKWYLYKNTTETVGNTFVIEVGYSPVGNLDPLGAQVVIETNNSEKLVKRVGSAGEVFSQSLMNIVHTGLGEEQSVKSVTVTWRNGETLTMDAPGSGKYSTRDNGFTSPVPTAIELGVTAKTLATNETYQLTPVLTPLNALSGVTYSSSDDASVSVTENGLITGLVDGSSATITVTSVEDASVTDTVTIDVSDIPNYVTAIAIDEPESTTLYSGDAYAITLTAQLTLENPLASPNDGTISWESSDSNVATIANGKVTGVTEGKATITATANGSKSGTEVSDSLELTIEEFKAIAVDMDNSWKYHTRANPIDQPMAVTVTYHAGSGSAISDGVRIYLRKLKSPSWGLLYDFTGKDTALQYDLIPGTAGTESGTVTYELSLPQYANDGLVTTAELAADEFYYLFIEMMNDKGERKDVGTQPVCITPAGTSHSDTCTK